MNRAKATALALVNWKGVFYERYLLDRSVTALEGANGAGKTTVMVAAYVVLMPDMTRLRFSNVGEGSGATSADKGVYGRLGEPGRPSYAAIEVDVGTERLVMGVCLVRKTEPQVELSPFLVRRLDLDGSLKGILLSSDGGEDVVPKLDDVVAAVRARGGTIDLFSSARDYFTALFDLGITPLRLASDEDRTKLNEMLRTSMTGGISRAITGELRSFLLREEPGLSETLTHMRANLDACHRTRTEVAEARVLERELSAVHDAARATVASALGAAFAIDQELAARRREAEGARDAARTVVAELASELAVARDEKRALANEQDRARTRLEERRADVEATLAARALEKRLDEERRHAQDLTRTYTERAAERDLAVAHRDERRVVRDRARDAYDRAARGLADVQSGLDDLHTSAAASRRLRAALGDAGTHLGRLVPLDPSSVAIELRDARAALGLADQRLTKLERDLATSDVRRAERAEALDALARLTGAERPPAEVSLQAVLAEGARLEAEANKVEGLRRELADARGLARRQRDLVESARALGFDAPAAGCHATVAQAVATADRRLGDLSLLTERLAAKAASSTAARDAAKERVLALTAVVTRYAAAASMAERLAGVLGVAAGSRLDPHAARARLDDLRQSSRDRLRDLEARATSIADEIERLERPGPSFDREILRLRDELDGELFSLRFEDLDVDDAARKEAALGELVAGIVVESPEAALRDVVGKARDVDTVLLVRPDAEATTGTIVGEAGGDVVVAEPFGLRVTRLPKEPSLGASARRSRAVRLREDAAMLRKGIDEERTNAARLDEAHRSLDTLFVDFVILEAGDPSPALAAARADIARLDEEAEVAARDLGAARGEAAGLRQKSEPLRALLSEGHLLELPDHTERERGLEASLATAEGCARELAAKAADYATVSRLAHALAGEPPNDETTRATRDSCVSERDALYRAVVALEDAETAAGAIVHRDAERLLAERATVVPALEEAHVQARAEAEALEKTVAEADATWERASRAAYEAELALAACRSEIQRLEGELRASGREATTEDDVKAAELCAAEAALAVTAAARALDGMSVTLAVLEERHANAERALEEALRAVAEREAEHEPWIGLVEGLREGVRVAEVPVPLPDEGEPASFEKARAMGEVLGERLARARGGAELAEVVRPRATLVGDRALAEAALTVWTDVTEWLRRRLPVAIASLPDPSTALLRLRDDLASLEMRLAHQETGLRGTSEDVARGIDVQLRRAKAQVRRLNQSLSGIRFGSIGGIRIQMAREPRMEQVLNALRDGTSQELLFDPRLTVEDALAEILKRYAGGRAGGQRVLDYREYLLLSVDIQRAGKSDWEQASPAKLSTGEGIGVGAAILMVILTEWERDGNLLRTRRPIGSMRFLFLDEANRLSQDNLATLFDLCQSLDLQLLVAAPEVARAEGATTYRLVRRTDDAGREEVVVSGRRALREASEGLTDDASSGAPGSPDENGARPDEGASPTLFD